jgi:hypothetical protein
MEESRYPLCYYRHVPSIRSFIYVLSNPGTLQRVTVSLEDVHIIADPLLDKYREECSGEAEGEGHKPKGVYADIGCRWIERREGWRWSRWDGNLWGNGRDLLGNLRKDGGMLLEVIHHFVCGADCQVLSAINHKRREGSGK